MCKGLRLFFGCASVVVGALFLLSAPVSASGDCPGMTDYTYNNGSCSENSDGLYDAMQKSYDRDYELQTGRMQRMEYHSSSPVLSRSSSSSQKSLNCGV